ncbi:MAG TPA: imidazole glycerol phosphate synthase subunit HisH [Bryobacteraceae bacterium]|nr:imidazole glycerol phosphate synthase subunit HisH [Bryobacteraceae bacterium]
MISVLDYGAGNLRSVENTLGAIGVERELIRDAAGLRRATKIILPGVGHFGQMIRALDEMDVRGALIERIRLGVPFLGICLGLQALFEASEEAPEQRGLGLLEGTVRRFHDVGRVPHMGWNSLDRLRESRLLEATGERPFVYFANSYYAPVSGATSASCDYGGAFSAVIESGNISAVQFHPEKSGPVGLAIVRNFVCS